MEVSSIQVNNPIAHTFTRRVYYPIELTFNDGTKTKFQRYYTDFVQLQAKCSNNSPPLPSKQSKNRELRRISFQYFLQWCLLHQTSLFYEFFGIQQQPTLIKEEKQQVMKKPTKSSTVLKFVIFSIIWLVLWQSMIPRQQQQPLTVSQVDDVDDVKSHEIIEVKESVDVHETIPVEQQETIKSVEEEEEEVAIVAVDDQKEESSDDAEKPQEEVEQIESPPVEVDVEENASTNDQPPATEIVPLESTHAELEKKQAEQVVVVSSEEKEEAVIVSEKVKSSKETIEIEETIKEDQFFTERGGQEEEEDSIEIRSKKHHQQIPLEDKDQVSFFFSPSHGVVAFIFLYLVTIIYSFFHPVRASKMPNELEIKFLNEGITSEDISIDSEEENNQLVRKSKEIISDISFDEARRIFDELTVSKRDQPSLNRAFALLLKATGETTKEQNPPYGVLSHFWQEVCSIPVKEAKSKFIDIVLSLDQSYSSSIGGENGGRGEEEEEEDSSSLESNSSAMDEDKSKLVVKWWDGLSPKSSIMTMTTPSPVKRVIGGEEDGENNQSFIITTPSISTELKLDEIDQLLQDEEEADIEEVQETVFFNEKNEFPDVALGTVLGFVGAAAFITSISRVRKLF